MAGARYVDVLFRDIGREPSGNQAQVLVQRGLDPVVLARRLGRLERHVVARLGEIAERVTRELAQELATRRKTALRRDDRGGGLIARCTRFLDVRDRDQSDLEALVCLFELPGEGVERRLRCFERV